jgi:hypothetical protein
LSKLPSTGPSLQRYLRQQARAAQRQQQSSAFNLSGTSVVAEDVTEVDGTLDVVGSLVVDGTETVNGPLAVHGTAAFDGATTIGGTLGVTGPTTLGAPTTVSGSLGVSGPMTVTGTLSLPAGIINNDALTSPVVPGYVNVASGVTFTTTTYGNVLSTTVTVPSGVTQLLANAQSGTWCQGNSNTTGGSNGTGGDAIYSRTSIGGVTGEGLGQPVLGSGSFGSVNSSLSTLLTGLTPGGTVTLQSQTFSGYQNIPANAGNKLTLTALLIWLR